VSRNLYGTSTWEYRDANFDGGRGRPSHPLLYLGIPALLWLLLANSCAPALRAFSAGPLSAKEQAAYAEANRQLIVEEVGIPKGASLGETRDIFHTDDDEKSVVSVTTVIKLQIPTGTKAIDAWRAANPDVAGPHPGLDAAFNEDVYGPIWERLEVVAAGLERLGFRHDVEYETHPGLPNTRSVSYRREGVSVWLGIEYPSGSISVYRDW
jgi:hypothetical protein